MPEPLGHIAIVRVGADTLAIASITIFNMFVTTLAAFETYGTVYATFAAMYTL